MFSTLYTLSLGENFSKSMSENPNNIRLFDKVKNKYPDIVELLKRGDIIENIDESGYRTQGGYMIDIVQNPDLDLGIIELIDIYVTDDDVPKRYHVISEFPLNYFDIEYIHINNDFQQVNYKYAYENQSGKTCFSWHYEEIPTICLHMKDFEDSILYNKSIICKDENKKFCIIFSHNDTNYLLISESNERIIFAPPIYNMDYIDEEDFEDIYGENHYDEILSNIKKFDIKLENILLNCE